MVASNSHIIRSQEFLIELDDKKDASGIQSGISLLQSTKIISIIDSVLSKYDDPDFIQIIHNIELDLGTVNKLNFEEEILYKLEEAIEAYMKLAVKENSNSKESYKISIGDRVVDDLEHFLINGYYKWNQTLTLTPSALLQKLREENQILLAAMLRKVTKIDKVGKRISFLFNDEEQNFIKNIITEGKEEITTELNPSETDTEVYKYDLKMKNESSPGIMPPIFINSVGLIIIAPYLETLFQRCGLMEDNDFIDESAQFMAIQLLAYAAIGDTILEEHQLIIQKVLCGIPISEPIDTSIEISPTNKELVDSLLMAVTQQWPPLNNTSIEGLRESFLLREGKLEEMEDMINLKVEQKPFDMLLDQIPWNISKIKLSWMPKILQVEWR